MDCDTESGEKGCLSFSEALRGTCGKIEDGGLYEVTTNTINSILIHKDDDVATAIADLNKDEVAQYVREGEIVRVEIAEHIPYCPCVEGYGK
jgi:hypothetical protein